MCVCVCVPHLISSYNTTLNCASSYVVAYNVTAPHFIKMSLVHIFRHLCVSEPFPSSRQSMYRMYREDSIFTSFVLHPCLCGLLYTDEHHIILLHHTSSYFNSLPYTFQVLVYDRSLFPFIALGM